MKISAELKEPLQAPSKDDVLFDFDSIDPMANARLNYSYRPDLFYSMGYGEAAKLLVEHVLKTYADQDTLVFPIAYLYRHHIELVIKRVLVLCAEVLKRPLSPPEKSHLKKHRLDLLWNDIKATLRVSYKRASGKMPPNAHIQGVDSYIRQLNERDKESDSFRYSTSKEGRRALADLTHINIRSLADKMERLSEFFAAIECQLELHLDFEAEMRGNAT